MMRARSYLDWNASAPLRPEARAAMLGALDRVGNPSSVHSEGRAVRAIVETARAQVAALVGCAPSSIVFTSGATEAAAMALGRCKAIAWPCDHDSVLAWSKAAGTAAPELGPDGRAIIPSAPLSGRAAGFGDAEIVALSHASGETGVLQPVEAFLALATETDPPLRSVCDISQALGRIPLEAGSRPLAASGLDLAICSAHKLGGPQGVGALCVLDK